MHARITAVAAPIRKMRWRVVLALGLLALGLWVAVPRRVDTQMIDPAAIGRAEAGLWRAYYERRYAQLALALVFSQHRLAGYSPLDSARSGLAAAEAAWRFQRSRSRRAAAAALPSLTAHFAIVARATGRDFDPARAARLELEWWQLRRETDTGAAAYAPAIAAATGYVQGMAPGKLAAYAGLRAEAMALRDSRGSAVTEADWARIEALLARAYAALAVQMRASR